MNPKSLLPTIHSPEDVKAIEEKDLPLLAEEVRKELISVLSQTIADDLAFEILALKA